MHHPHRPALPALPVPLPTRVGASSGPRGCPLSPSSPLPKIPPAGARARLEGGLAGGLTRRRPPADLLRTPVEGFSAGLLNEENFFEWQITVMGPQDTLYEGGCFKTVLKFPPDYPNNPPSCRFTSEMWHPNVYTDGNVCISILHPAGDDPNGYERADERWSPIHTVETIMLSIISMLSCPNDESPANIDAAKQWREDPKAFRKKVQRIVQKSQEEF